MKAAETDMETDRHLLPLDESRVLAGAFGGRRPPTTRTEGHAPPSSCRIQRTAKRTPSQDADTEKFLVPSTRLLLLVLAIRSRQQSRHLPTYLETLTFPALSARQKSLQICQMCLCSLIMYTASTSAKNDDCMKECAKNQI